MITRRHSLFLGCLALGATVTPARGETAPSGFLGDYEALAATNDAAVTAYRKPDLNLQAYDKLLVEEILFWYADDSPYKGIGANDLQHIGRTAFASLQKNVSPRFAIVTEPTQGTLRIRVAITNIRAARKGRSILAFTPIGLIKQGVGAMTGTNIELRDATAEADLSDAMSGERLIAIHDARPATRDAGETGKASWYEIQKTLDAWAVRLTEQLGAAQTPAHDL